MTGSDVRWQQRLDNCVRALAQLRSAVTPAEQRELTGSRDATRQAFSVGLVEDGEARMEMIQSRNQSFHTYNRATALSLVERITKRYAALFEQFAQRMNELRNG
ncbi:MAG: nucleotidyltransferase substrate binding protein [Janthinobacterium lividum]